jgi:hypothetical protein
MEGLTDELLLRYAPQIAFLLGPYMLTWTVRRGVEGAWPIVRVRGWWDKSVLPILPPCFGVLMAALMVDFPYPPFVTGTSVRLLYGLTMGFFSAWGFRLFRATVKKRTGIDLSQTLPISGRSFVPPSPRPPPPPPPPPPDDPPPAPPEAA